MIRFQFLSIQVHHRTKMIARNSALNLIVKGISLFVGLAMMPVSVSFFSNQTILGIWLTLLSMLSWIFNMDFGIGNGLRNKLVSSLANENYEDARALISSAYIGSIILSCIFAIVINMVLTQISVNDLFHISQKVISSELLKQSIQIQIGGVLVQFVLKLISSILYSMHKAAVPGILSLVSNISILLFMLLLPNRTDGRNFVNISIVYVIATNLPLLAATFFVFSHKLRHCIPSFRCFHFKSTISLVVLGAGFLWLQLMELLINSTNSFLISYLVSVTEVVPFQVYLRLYSLVSMIYIVSITPIWSSVTEAYAKREFLWIVKTRNTLFLLMCLPLLLQLLMLIFTKQLIGLWMGNDFQQISHTDMIIVAIFIMISIWMTINSVIGNGMGKLKNQIIFLTIGAMINIPLSFIFVQLLNSWSAVVLANIVSSLPYCVTETISTSAFLRKRIAEKSFLD